MNMFNIIGKPELHVIYMLLPPIYRIQFARVCERSYSVSDPAARDIGQIIRSRLSDPYILNVFTSGGYIVGDILMDCLYSTDYSDNIEMLFTVGAGRCNYWNVAYAIDNRFDAFIYGLKESMYVFPEPGVDVYSDATGQTNGFNRKTVYISTTKCIITITDSGINNYFNQCNVEFYKIAYDGERFIARNPMSLIRKQSAISNANVIDICQRMDAHGMFEFICPYRRCGKNFISDYAARGFHIV